MKRAPFLALSASLAIAPWSSTAASPPDTDATPLPMTSAQIEVEISERETEIEIDRKRAIGLLEEFIHRHAQNRAMPEALYRLAALYWERSQERFLADMEAFGKAVDTCKADHEACPKGPPAEPQLDLSDSQVIYARMLGEYPQFRKIDTVMFLYGFSLRDQGQVESSQALFWRIIKEHPQSTFVPDSWMAVGDQRFYGLNDFAGARDAYSKVLEHPSSTSYPMALFKTAWSHWKLGEREAAIRRFKDVLEQVESPEQDAEGRKRLADLRDEALEYLVQVLTEDETQTPKEIHAFLLSIGGEKYSRKVLVRLAEAYENQARYDKSVPGFEFLIELDGGLHVEDASFQIHIFTGKRGQAKTLEALAALQQLHTQFGEGGAWAKKHPEASRQTTTQRESLHYDFGRSLHESAQAVEAATKVPDAERYALTANVYEDYVIRFPANPHAVELAYLTGDIYLLKLDQPGRAADAYLRVGESAPVGPLHRDALLAAMTGYEQAMARRLPEPTTAGTASEPPPKEPVSAEPAPKEPAPTEAAAVEPPKPSAPARYNYWERGYIRAADVFAQLFPADPEIAAVIHRLGEFFYGRGDFDGAVQRFGRVVVDYPESDNAAASGDRILDALAGAKDYDNIELWATKLKSAPSFKPEPEQERLNRIIVESLLKQGEALAARGYYSRAANYYLRVPNEYPKHAQAALALNNAGASLERAHRAADSTAVYRRLAQDYPGTPEGGQATLIVARVFENIARYDAAAAHYDKLVTDYPKHPERANALQNAGVLYQALGQSKNAIDRYQKYAKQYSDREDAADVELRAGQVYAREGQNDQAIASFQRFLKRPSHADRAAEALTRLGNSQIAAKKFGDAEKSFTRATKVTAAGLQRAYQAEAMFRLGELIYRDFEAQTLDARPNKLAASLEKKAKLLNSAKDSYLSVLGYASPEWSTAALLRIGESFEGFARGLRDYPVPKGLSEEDEAAYSDQLETFALAFEEQAIEAFKSGYSKALELKIFNRHTRAIRAALGRLSKREFPPIAEMGTETVVAGSSGRVAQPMRRLAR